MDLEDAGLHQGYQVVEVVDDENFFLAIAKASDGVVKPRPRVLLKEALTVDLLGARRTCSGCRCPSR
jgi:hypothetical protein